MPRYLPKNNKTGDFNPQRTLSGSFFVIPERLESTCAVVLAFTMNKQTNTLIIYIDVMFCFMCFISLFPSLLSLSLSHTHTASSGGEWVQEGPVTCSLLCLTPSHWQQPCSANEPTHVDYFPCLPLHVRMSNVVHQTNAENSKCIALCVPVVMCSHASY